QRHHDAGDAGKGLAADASQRRDRAMIPAAFDYVVPRTVPEAIAELVKHGQEAKVLAGGHSLIPLMKLRLATPSFLVDIGRINGLNYIREEDGQIAIGALTTHREIRIATPPEGSLGTYLKFSRRSQDWAIVAVAAQVTVSGHDVARVAIGLTGMSSRPLCAAAVEQALRGKAAHDDDIRKASERAADGTDPPQDLNGSP